MSRANKAARDRREDEESLSVWLRTGVAAVGVILALSAGVFGANVDTTTLPALSSVALAR